MTRPGGAARRLPVLALLCLAVVTGARADRARLLADPRDAMLARAELIRGARREILVESFILGDDRLTFGFLALLREAAARGVDVKLIGDATWNRVPSPVQAHLRETGVEIRDYHPLRLDRLNWITQRLHDKLLIVDGEILLVGGRNVEAPYFADGANVERRDYVDCDVALESAEAQVAREYFLQVWDGRHVEALRHACFDDDRAKAAADLDAGRAWLEERMAEWRGDPAFATSPWRDVRAARFLHDPPDGKLAGRGVGEQLMDAMRAARSEIVVESPYVVPGRRLRAALLHLQRNHVRLRILTNSLGTTDNLWPQAAYAGDKKSILATGAALHEYRGPEALHSKVMVIDDATSIIGSFNMDVRSHQLSTEVAVIIEDEELARELRAVMDAHVANSWTIGPNGKPVGESRRHPGVSRMKVLRMQVRRLFVPFVRRQI